MANGRDYGERASFPAATSSEENAAAAANPMPYFNMQQQHSDYLLSAVVAAPPQSPEMSAMVTALTHVVSGQPYNGGGIPSSYGGNFTQTSIHSPPSSVYSSSTSGRKRNHGREDSAPEYSQNLQRVYRGLGDSLGDLKSGLYFY